MELSFIPFIILFALLFGLLVFIRTLLRKTEIVFSEILMAFFAALIPLASLITGNLDGINDNQVEPVAITAAASLVILGIVLIIVELFRPQRLKQSRGILTFGVGLMIGIAALIVPLTGAYFTLPPQETAPETVVVGQATEDPASEFFTVFNNVMQLIADSSGLSVDEVLSALDDGKTVAQLVESGGGDIEKLIDDITEVMQDFLRNLVAENRIDRLRAATGIAGMEIVVRYAVNNDISTLRRAGEGETDNLTPEPTPGTGTPRESFFAFLTATDPAVVAAVSESIVFTATPVPTITPLPPTLIPTATRTPRPSPTATSTRALYVTRTPTLTPTLPSPCLAVMNFNVNMREEPDLEATLLLTVPYESVVNVFGRNQDTTWWYAEYEGSAGWIKAEFVTATSSCNQLPVR